MASSIITCALKNRPKSSIIHSFKYAFEGLGGLWKESNFKIHLFVSMITLIAGFAMDISRFEWIAVLLCIFSMLAMEGINTAIERLCDFVSPDIHPKIKKIKDISAAAVLLVAIASVIIGLIIFLPKIK